jgi:hypothetical protein
MKNEDPNSLIKKYIRALVESNIRETDIADGSRVAFGSKKHVDDLLTRINDLERWRDRQRRGSDARANYARLISQLRKELRSATNYSEKKAIQTMDKLSSVDISPDDLSETASKKVTHYAPMRGHASACGVSKGEKTAARADVTCSKCKSKMNRSKDAFRDDD